MEQQNMHRRMEQYIDENKMLQQGDRVVIGVSGGCDSVCLLLCLCSLAPGRQWDLSCIHVHHGIRGAEADRDERFVTDLCRRLGVGLKVYHEDIPALAEEKGWSLEEAGRFRRYEIFRREAGDRKIAVAHHRDDQSETVLFQMLRGSGIRGLGAMAPVQGNLIRPLLFAGRREIEEFLRKEGQEWCNDSTNEDTNYSRNRVRHQLLPIAREINEQADLHLNQLAAMARETEDYMEQQAGEWMNRWAETRSGGYVLPMDVLSRQHPALRSRIYRLCMEKNGSRKDVGYLHFQSIDRLLCRKTGASEELPGGRKAEVAYGKLYIGYPEKEPQTIVRPRLQYRMFFRENSSDFPKKEYTKWLDYDTIKGSLMLRTRQEGDYFLLKGGGRKSLKSFLIDRKIPAGERDRIWLLADGSHVLWVIGLRLSEGCKISEHTEKILEVAAGGDYEESC